MRVYLDSLGCRLNGAELRAWSADFVAAGHRMVRTPADAELMVLNTCAVTTRAGRESRQRARQLHRQSPEARLVLTGCYSELEPDAAAALMGVDLVVPNTDKDRLVSRVLEEVDVDAMPSAATEPDSQPVFASRRTRAFVKVGDGCRNRCTFCIVTVARGAERSRSIPELVAEVAALHAEGVQEVVLTGVHIGGYGADLGVDLAELIEALLRNTQMPRIRMGSLEPWGVPDRLFELFADRRLCPHLHLPLQSGADVILRRMARRNTASAFEALAGRARNAGLTLTTDLIVGFPGETEALFEESVRFVAGIGFAHVHCFNYSRRPGTAAAQMSGQVDRDERKRRARVVAALARRMTHDVHAAAVGEVRPVLFERSSVAGRWRGYTDHYLPVEVVHEDDLHNRILPVRLEGLGEDRHMRGQLA